MTALLQPRVAAWYSCGAAAPGARSLAALAQFALAPFSVLGEPLLLESAPSRRRQILGCLAHFDDDRDPSHRRRRNRLVIALVRS